MEINITAIAITAMICLTIISVNKINANEKIQKRDYKLRTGCEPVPGKPKASPTPPKYGSSVQKDNN